MPSHFHIMCCGNEKYTKTTMAKKTICIDFDGVIHKYSKGWHDGTIYDPPSEGTWDALNELAEDYKIVVLTARARTPEAIEEIGNYLKAYDLDQFITNITNIKPAAAAYIDDKAIRFEGDWDLDVFDFLMWE